MQYRFNLTNLFDAKLGWINMNNFLSYVFSVTYPFQFDEMCILFLQRGQRFYWDWPLPSL